jgi:hypothetical protein
VHRPRTISPSLRDPNNLDDTSLGRASFYIYAFPEVAAHSENEKVVTRNPDPTVEAPTRTDVRCRATSTRRYFPPSTGALQIRDIHGILRFMVHTFEWHRGDSHRLCLADQVLR